MLSAPAVLGLTARRPSDPETRHQDGGARGQPGGIPVPSRPDRPTLPDQPQAEAGVMRRMLQKFAQDADFRDSSMISEH